LRQFLGLSLYYRRFIPKFAKIAQSLHHLTKKDVTVSRRLYWPTHPLTTLKTDASIQGLGAVLSQLQSNSRLHPVAYASRSLTLAEANYSITELEILAVVWAITDLHSYLYGHSVTVYTDHTPVKAPNPSGKHSRWWNRVYGKGAKELKIVYRSGRINLNADAHSRSPVGPVPIEGPDQNEV
jgi:hypothetical protein